MDRDASASPLVRDTRKVIGHAKSGGTSFDVGKKQSKTEYQSASPTPTSRPRPAHSTVRQAQIDSSNTRTEAAPRTLPLPGIRYAAKEETPSTDIGHQTPKTLNNAPPLAQRLAARRDSGNELPPLVTVPLPPPGPPCSSMLFYPQSESASPTPPFVSSTARELSKKVSERPRDIVSVPASVSSAATPGSKHRISLGRSSDNSNTPTSFQFHLGAFINGNSCRSIALDVFCLVYSANPHYLRRCPHEPFSVYIFLLLHAMRHCTAAASHRCDRSEAFVLVTLALLHFETFFGACFTGFTSKCISGVHFPSFTSNLSFT